MSATESGLNSSIGKVILSRSRSTSLALFEILDSYATTFDARRIFAVIQASYPTKQIRNKETTGCVDNDCLGAPTVGDERGQLAGDRCHRTEKIDWRCRHSKSKGDGYIYSKLGMRGSLAILDCCLYSAPLPSSFPVTHAARVRVSTSTIVLNDR